MTLITNTDTTVFPYNGTDMVYDLDTRQYIITIAGVRNMTGINLVTLTGTTELADLFCLEASEIIYNYVYSMSQLQQIDYKRYWIAKDGDLRYLFKRILASQIKYMRISGANLLGFMHGVNIEKSKVLPLDSLRGMVEISSQSINMLKQSGLLYAGYHYHHDFTEDGTW